MSSKAVILLFYSIIFSSAYANDELNQILNSMAQDIVEVNQIHQKRLSELYIIEKQLFSKLSEKLTVEEKINFLIEREKLIEQIQLQENLHYLDISKIRYLKGIQVIRLLYGKILALDHHFEAVSTLQDINAISNPNNYPQYLKLKEEISKSADKKQGFEISPVLKNNIYTSMVYSLVSVFNATGKSKEEKQQMIREIECILDFTLRVHNDLNTIYFETSYLKKQNQNIKQDIMQLFEDFTQPIKYTSSLEEFRQKDDWENLKSKMENYLQDMQNVINDKSQSEKARRMRVNIEFPTDRLLQFLTQYNAFINQGTNFYEKFLIMLNAYEEEKQCSENIPNDYKRLQMGVIATIEKFNTAYKPVEVNGTKLKEILYGLNEYN